MLVGALAGSVLLFAPAVGAPLIAQPSPLVTEHVDLNIYYAGGAWDLRPYDGDLGGFAHPGNEAILHVDARSLTSVPSSGYEFVGAGSAGMAYVLTQSQNPELLYLGFAGYGATPVGQWDRYDPSVESGGRVSGRGRWLKVSLDSVQGPGEFSLWQSEDLGPNIFMSTASGGITAEDAIWIVANGHTHYNFGFTERGLYRLTLVPSGYLGDGGANNTTIEGVFSQAEEPIAIYLNVDPGYATSGVVASSALTLRGSTAANGSGFSEVVLPGGPLDGAISVSGVDTASPAYILLDLADESETGALNVGLSGTANYSPGNPAYLSEVYFLEDVPATAVIDDSVLASHAGYDLALRFDALPGAAFAFEFDYSMILDGVGVARVGVLADAASACTGDLNADGVVDDADFVPFAAAYNILLCDDPSMPEGCPADLNADGFVDDADFVLFAAAYDALLCP